MKAINVTCCAVSVLLSAACFGATTHTEEVDGITWTYMVSGGEAIIGVKYPSYYYDYGYLAVPKTTLGAITIPSTLGGYPVTSIGPWAFRECNGLTSVKMPNGVKSIGDKAFYGCSSLTSITIPYGVKSIESDTFRDCSSLISITMPDSMMRISDSAFYGCSRLVSVTIPDSVTSIGEYAFGSCSGLTSVTIPNSVTSIGDSVFYSCNSLTSITIPQAACSKQLLTIVNVSSLTNVVISSSVTSIGSQAFSGYSSLTSITIPDSVASIGDYAFRGCSGLTGVTIPDSVTSIGYGAFEDCIGLTSIMIPDSVTNIGSDAFSGCTGLASFFNNMPDGFIILGKVLYAMKGDCPKYVAIPNGVVSIGASSFYKCSNLERILISRSVENIGYSAFEGCTSLAQVVIPDGVKSIGGDAFSGCSNLASVTIGKNVGFVGSYAFEDCSNLTNIIFRGNAPAAQYKPFARVSSDCKALVRQDSSGWNVDIPGTWKDISIDYIRKLCVNDEVALGNIESAAEIMADGVINESNFDFCIPADYVLPAGAVVRIKSIRLASLNDTFMVWDATTNRSDPYYIYLNGVRSDAVNNGTGALSAENMIASNAETNDYALTYTFSTPCDIVVGKKYPAVTGNSIGRAGTGLALLHSNGNLLYGSGADRASVRYIKSDDADSVITTTTAKSITGEDGWCPVYEIEAEVVSIESVAFDYTAVSSNHTILPIEGGWFKGSSYFAGGTPQNSLLRIGPSEKYKFALQTTPSTCPYYNVDAKTNSFSLAIYADVSQMPSDGRAIMVAFGRDGGNILAIYRDGEEVSLAFVDSQGVIIGEAASVAVGDGYHLYVATCDPAIGEISLSLDGNNPVLGGTDHAVLLGNGFQIGSVYGKMRNGFTCGADMAIVKMLGYDAILSAETVAQLANDYPAVLGGAFCQETGLGALPTLWRSDALFLGWFTEVDGGVMIDETTIPTGDMRLCAHWLTAVATPVVSPGDGVTFRGETGEVEITCETEVASIYYSTDGSEPTIDVAHLYSGPFVITDSTTVKAIAVAGTQGSTMICSEVATATISQHELTFAEAIESGEGVSVTTSEDVPWEPVYNNGAKVGDSSVRSGGIGDRTNTWISATVSGAGSLTFWCKTSCEHDEDNTFTWDRLMVYTNEVEISAWRMDGEADWTKRTLTFEGGENVIKWVYYKDKNGKAGEDCAWLDEVVWTPAPSAPAVAIDNTKMETPVVDEATGTRTIAAKEGKTLTETDVENVTIASPLDSSKDITAAYVKTLDAVENKIVLTLAEPEVKLPKEEEDKDNDDPSGVLANVELEEIESRPTPDEGEDIGALPVKTYPGLWYQAAWGDDLVGLTEGDKVQATGDSLYLGVIKQKGPKGFYRLTVSETE